MATLPAMDHAPQYAGDLTPQEAWARLQSDPDAALVDVRTEAEWAYVGAPDLTDVRQDLVPIEWISFPDGAQNPRFLDQLAEAVAPGDRTVLFLCRSGARSVAAATAATAAGYSRAYNILDGFEGRLDDAGHRSVDGWKVAGLPWRQG